MCRHMSLYKRFLVCLGKLHQHGGSIDARYSILGFVSWRSREDTLSLCISFSFFSYRHVDLYQKSCLSNNNVGVGSCAPNPRIVAQSTRLRLS